MIFYKDDNYYHTYFILVEVAKKLQKHLNYIRRIDKVNKKLLIFFGLHNNYDKN